jgi:nitrite reductase (NO-forming)
MSMMNESVERRTVLKRMGALGAVPLVGAVGAACRAEPAAPAADTAADGYTDAEANVAAAAADVQEEAKAPPEPVNVDYLPNPEAAPPLGRTTNETVQVTIECKELEAKLSDGASYTAWTFGGTVPGPMIRVLEGDTVELTLTNASDSTVGHNIDLHAVTGPGGGAAITNVGVGESKSISFKALHPGVYIYHCATAPIDLHIANGMYGLIVVEPEGGLAPVDRELYICQGEIYTPNPAGTPGKQQWDMASMSSETPSHVVFNGAIGAIAGDRGFKANVGESVRIFFGVGGPNKTSSFHVIGEIFDRAATWGSFSSMAENVQTISVAPGGATMVEFDLQVPGSYVIVDHALSRLTKGAAGHIHVEGAEAPDIYKQL